MRFIQVVALVAALGQAVADDDIILQPMQTDTSLPERLLVFLPGGLVPNAHYKLTGQAIQNATTGVRLTVVIPAVFQKLCIILCPNPKICSPLKSRIDSAVAKSGFKSKNPKEDTFLAGHSLGATCTNYLAQSNSYEYAGLMEFGGFIDMTGPASIPNFPIPVLHMAGELDGGGARVSTMAGLYKQSSDSSKSLEDALVRKPVHVLEGVDHSNFCPGFFVTKTKDCVAEVSQDVALAKIGEGAAAFLHLNTPTSNAIQVKAMATMKTMAVFTQEMVKPFLTAFQLEKEQLTSPPEGVPAGPWCEVAQYKIVGLGAADASKFRVQAGYCKLITTGLHQFEHQHTNYTTVAGSMTTTCFSAVEAPGSSIENSQFSPKSIDCKMVDATRVAEQLNVKTDANVSCADINRMAVEVAKKLVPAKSAKRFEEKGRGFCFMPDTTVFENIGPLWVKSGLTIKETTNCLEVASSKLISTIKSMIFPGNHYCKLYSVSAAMDWIMTDGHKPFPYHGPDVETTEIIQI